jgi:hypothetical protein
LKHLRAGFESTSDEHVNSEPYISINFAVNKRTDAKISRIVHAFHGQTKQLNEANEQVDVGSREHLFKHAVFKAFFKALIIQYNNIQ